MHMTMGISKRVLVQNHSNENKFDLHENEHASKTQFHMKSLAPGLVSKQRQKELGIAAIRLRAFRSYLSDSEAEIKRKARACGSL